jgi:WD40 repeat protein/tRNA A-37 threonylcarbamoyl transferase component Bud32
MPDEPALEPLANEDEIIANRYRLRQLLGAGTFGEVFAAEDTKFDPPRKVAVKLLRPQFVSEPQVREDIKREASALGRFSHPNILRVLDFEVSARQAYIVTEFAEGGSLATKLRPDPSRPPVPIPLPQVAEYLRQIADALDEAHNYGLIHRDIKPQNILLDGRGSPLLADFGLAAAVTSSSSSLVNTNTSGTPLYMAPEQWNGFVSKASDNYALGVLLYQMITGQTPFQGNQAALAWQHINSPVPKLVDRAPWLSYPPALDEVLAAAMAKEARDRPRQAGEIYQRFKAALEGQPENSSATIMTATLPITASPTLNPASQPTVIPAASVTSAATLQATPSRGQGQKGLLWAVAGGAVLVTVAIIAIVLAVINGNNSATTNLPAGNGQGNTGQPVGTVSTTEAGQANPIPTSTGPFGGHSDHINAVAWSPDGKTLLTGSSDQTLKLWTPDGKLVKSINAHRDAILAVGWSPDGKSFFSTSEDRLVRVWAADGTPLFNLNGSSDAIYHAIWSPDGKTLATTWNGDSVRLWAADGKPLTGLASHNSTITCIAWSPDGKTLATASLDQRIKLWSLDGKEVATLSDHFGAVRSIAWSKSGILASAADDGTVRLWSSDGKLLHTMTGHKDPVKWVAWSPDGRILASGGADKKVLLWSSDGKLLTTFEGHTDTVRSISWMPDGRSIASGADDATVRIWRVNL